MTTTRLSKAEQLENTERRRQRREDCDYRETERIADRVAHDLGYEQHDVRIVKQVDATRKRRVTGTAKERIKNAERMRKIIDIFIQ